MRGRRRYGSDEARKKDFNKQTFEVVRGSGELWEGFRGEFLGWV
jgi:hypothetical protein